MMSDAPYDSDDLSFLLSRRLDGDLGSDEQRRLDEELGRSKVLRQEARDLESVDRLVKRWGRTQVELDWEAHAALTVAEATGETADPALSKVDALLRRMGGTAPELDWDRFGASVLSRTHGRPNASTTPPRRLIFRLGIPLAAAAAVLITVTTTLWRAPSDARENIIVIGPVARVTGWDSSPTAEPILEVRFGRNPQRAAPSRSSRVAFVSVGADPLPTRRGGSAPL